MTRITESDVADLMPNVDITVEGFSLNTFMDQAHALTNVVAAKDSEGILSAVLLKQIEANLAAHYYSFKKQQYNQRQTENASGQFLGKTDKGLDYSPWGQTAKELDVTGYLASLGQQGQSGRKKVRVVWLGTEESGDRSRDLP